MEKRLLATDATRMEDVAARAVAIGRAVGADAVVATARANAGVRVRARAGAIDTALRDAGQGLSLTLYRGGAKGTASTAALDDDAIRIAAEEAFAIAGLTTADADSLPAELAIMASDTPLPPLDAPAGLDVAALRDIAITGDAAIRAASVRPRVTIETLGFEVSSRENAWALATSAGFCRGEMHSTHAIWATALARDAAGAATDHAGANDRRFDRLQPLDTVAARAVTRAASHLGARSVPGHRGAVLFEARVATALIGDLSDALFGNRQQSGTSFLPVALGTAVAADHVDLVEDPFEPYGLASGASDGEDIAGQRRAILDGGGVAGYFLNLRSARLLGMAPTGNANGPWNLRLTSRRDGGSFEALCRSLWRGLVIDRVMGGSTNPITGSWSYAVSGTWIENGVPTHAITDITVGGKMRDMLRGITAVGDDVHRAGGIRTGSLLIDGMQVGGAA